MEDGKSALLIASAVLGSAYMAYSAWYWFGGGAVRLAGGDAVGAAGAIATALVTPHLLLALIAVMFNIAAASSPRAGFALAAGILYAVSILLFVPYLMFEVVQMALCFAAFMRLRRSRDGD